MKKQQLVTAALLFIAALIIGGVFFLKKPADSHSAAESGDIEVPESDEEMEIAEAISMDAGNSKPISVTRLSSPASQIPWSPQVKVQLKSFQQFQNKSVMTNDEEEARLKLLQDADLISQVSGMLRSRLAQKDAQAFENQNIAIDLLIEALKEGNEQAATDAIWDQIRDGQVEDSSIPLGERKTLAGIKGELIYHATALRPDSFQDIEMDLPGPVSQKIWKNVQEQHQANLESSQTEADEHVFNQSPSEK